MKKFLLLRLFYFLIIYYYWDPLRQYCDRIFANDNIKNCSNNTNLAYANILLPFIFYLKIVQLECLI